MLDGDALQFFIGSFSLLRRGFLLFGLRVADISVILPITTKWKNEGRHRRAGVSASVSGSRSLDAARRRGINANRAGANRNANRETLDAGSVQAALSKHEQKTQSLLDGTSVSKKPMLAEKLKKNVKVSSA